MTSEIRQRLGFKDEPEDDLLNEEEQRILDEQEQEEIIRRIRETSAKADYVHLQSLRMILVVSATLQLVFFLTQWSWPPNSPYPAPTPLAGLFNSSRGSPLIPCAIIFTLTTLTLHVLDFLALGNPTTSPSQSNQPRLLSSNVINIPIQIPSSLFISSQSRTPLSSATLHIDIPRPALHILAPALSLLLRRDFPQTIWWALPGLLTGFIMLAQRWMNETTENMDRLERLRYDSKGA
ncbi:hypothetical protein FRC02_003231 [Tulasnella sp. 418]|nr:hypothetical protein FRC02_003231 [Tulasnella sp. 418]